MTVAAPICSRHWMDAVDSDGWRQAGATGTMLSHGQMKVAAPIAPTLQNRRVVTQGAHPINQSGQGNVITRLGICRHRGGSPLQCVVLDSEPHQAHAMSRIKIWVLYAWAPQINERTAAGTGRNGGSKSANPLEYGARLHTGAVYYALFFCFGMLSANLKRINDDY